MTRYRSTEFSELLGKTLSSATPNGVDELNFYCTDGSHYRLWHHQDCCESVTIDDICGDLDDVVGEPLVVAEEVLGRTELTELEREVDPSAGTWTFYKLDTIKGGVTIRWFGSSNGYYSETVDFDCLEEAHEAH